MGWRIRRRTSRDYPPGGYSSRHETYRDIIPLSCRLSGLDLREVLTDDPPMGTLTVTLRSAPEERLYSRSSRSWHLTNHHGRLSDRTAGRRDKLRLVRCGSHEPPLHAGTSHEMMPGRSSAAGTPHGHPHPASHNTPDAARGLRRGRKVNRTKRAVLPCEPCRKAKVKCDEMRPTCGHCQQRHIRCSNGDSPAEWKRMTRIWTKRLEDVEKKVQVLRDTLEQQRAQIAAVSGNAYFLNTTHMLGAHVGGTTRALVSDPVATHQIRDQRIQGRGRVSTPTLDDWKWSGSN